MFGAKVIITLENTKKIMFYSHRGFGKTGITLMAFFMNINYH